jgi:hypothetical protein
MSGAMAPSRLIASFAVLAAGIAALPASADATPGSVTLVRTAGAPATLAEQAFLRTHIWRMHGATAWDAASWVRRSAYALDATTAAAHPDWVLKDAYGNKLYLGAAPAADFGNPAYRAWWIAQARTQVDGVRGLYVDDVSMERRVTFSWGTTATPKDPRTNGSMTEANWQRYMADFMVELRAALPSAEIVHDVLWYKGDTAANVVRELGAADAVALEKGFNDPTITTWAGGRGWDALAAFVTRRQAAGTSVVLDGYAESADARLYGLATALLLDTGKTLLGNDAWTAPNRYWTGYDLDLGAPAGPRGIWQNVWRRDFEDGLVLVNPPGAPAVELAVGPDYVDLDGTPRDTLTLAGGQAMVLVHVPASAPTSSTETGAGTPVAPAPIEPEEPAVAVAPVAPAPVAAPTPVPRRPLSAATGRKAHLAGAAAPKTTSVRVDVSRLGVAGKVENAVSGYVRVSVQRKRGSAWTPVRRVKVAVSRKGTFRAPIERLAGGTYRALATFEGTGTALPSTSAYRTRSL